MSSLSHPGARFPPRPLEQHAANQLAFIRSTMERAAVFTAVPGWGGVAIGCTALLTGILAEGRPLRAQQLLWLLEAIVAAFVGAAALWHKSKRLSQPLSSKPARRAIFSFLVPLLAGAVLTAALYRHHAADLIPGLWLLLYGVAIVSAGAHSVRIVPAMGLCFLGLGCAALLTPNSGANLYMTLGFAGLHIAFGAAIARRYGG